VLHDIGKIGVRDSILKKAGALTDDEYDEMQRHAELGARILAGANLDDISGWVLAHHERPDGHGYPHSLRDHEIPLEAKILAVADSYEAMTSDRVYRKALGHDIAQAELLRCAGGQFDPEVVDALIAALTAERDAAPQPERIRA
jgi:HD-GYP domain-containing protein (c-di-GMP phosphodiesterase class II)